MKTIRALLAAAALCVGLAACSGGDARGEIETAFKGYHTALLARDFPAACAFNAPESTDKLLAALATQGVSATTCEQALTAIYAEPGAADTADAISRSVKIDNIEVDGDEATITWTATLDGEASQVSNPVRLIDGGWKLVAAG